MRLLLPEPLVDVVAATLDCVLEAATLVEVVMATELEVDSEEVETTLDAALDVVLVFAGHTFADEDAAELEETTGADPVSVVLVVANSVCMPADVLEVLEDEETTTLLLVA